MISDNILLSLLGNRDNYFKYRSAVQIKALLERSVQIFKDLEDWYVNNPTIKDVNWYEFSEYFKFVKHPSLSEEDSQLYSIIFERIAKTDLCGKLAEDILKLLIERSYAKKLMQLGQNIANGKASVLDGQEILDECNDVLGTVDDLSDDPDLITDDVVTLLEDMYGEHSVGFDWPLKELNVSLGPLRIGNSVLMAAFVDSGKTSFIIYCLQHMAKQLKSNQQVIYFSNEEAGATVKLRFIQSMLGWTPREMRVSYKETFEAYKKLFDPRQFVLYHNPTMSVRYVEEKLRKHNPGLICIDQLQNLSGFNDATSTVDRVTQLAQWSRRISNKAPVIFASQANGECNGVKFIEMDKLYNSRVGIQGAVDAVITLGRERGAAKDQFQRGLYLPKNKMLGGDGVDPMLRNGKFDLTFDVQRCKFKGSL